MLAAIAELPPAAAVGGELAVLEPAAARLRGCAPPGAAARTAARAPGTLSARAAGRCGRSPCCRPRPPGSRPCGRGRSRRQSGRGGSRPTGTAPWRVSPANPICSMNCSQISAHRSSASSGSCGCRLSEQCHTCASRAPITRPFSLSRSAIVTRVPNASRGSSRNRASATRVRSARASLPSAHP